MRVEAIRLGFYNGSRRRAGEEFDLSDSKHFSKVWMKKKGGRKGVSKDNPQEAKPPGASAEGSQSVI